MSFTAFFIFDWNKKSFIKIIKTKRWEDKHAFVDKIFNYELREAFFQRCSVKKSQACNFFRKETDSSKIMAIRTHESLYGQSSVKIPAHQ